MSKTIEDVDFDFFDTPRESVNSPPRSPGKYFDRKPPPSPTANKHGERPASGFLQDFRQKDEGRSITKPEDDIDEDIYSESFSSDTESETPRVGQGKGSSYNDKKDTKGKQYSDSSSAYSNSDYSSDDSSDKVNYNNNRKKEKIDVTVPKMKVDAWVHQSTKNDLIGGKNHKSRRSDRSQVKQKSVGNRSYSQSSESDSSNETHDSLENKKNIDRVKSAKSSEDRHMNKVRKPLRSTSSSYSNNSDITDVSPLESPEISPRVVRKQFKNTSEKENGQYDDVQYKSPEKEADIKLESDEIDLSILMKCMADIDKEKQQRLKANTRRVMFAPPSSITHDKGNQNFTFSMGRAKMIERENQRLLKQIMQHVGTGSGKQKSQTKPKKLVHAEPVVPRLTPSAVNRMREQRRIEMENLVCYDKKFCFTSSRSTSSPINKSLCTLFLIWTFFL